MKSKLFSVLALLCLITSAGSAQFLNYYANFGNSHYKMNFTCVVPANCNGAGNIYAIGTVDSIAPSRNKNIYVAEIDPNGSIVWDKQYRITVKANEVNDGFNCVSAMETSDGYLVIAGNRITPGLYVSNGFVLKIKACSNPKNIIWFQQLKENSSFLRIIEKTGNPSKYYVSGQDMQVGNSATSEDALLVEVDPTLGTLTMVSNRTLSGSDTWFSVAYDPGSNAFYTGGRYNYNSGNTMMRQSITKLDASFNEVWSYPYVKNITTDQARLYLNDLILSNSNLYAVGNGDDAAQGGGLTQQYIKTDLNGTLLSGKKYTMNSGGPGSLHQIISIPGSKDLIILGDLSNQVAGIYGNAYLMRVKPNGNIVWANEYPFTLVNYLSIAWRMSGITIQKGYLYAVGQYVPSSQIPQAALLKVDPADGRVDCSSPLGVTASGFTYQGPLTPMSAENYLYTHKNVTSKKLDLTLDWNLICGAYNPCVNDTIDLGDHVLCANGGSFPVCNQIYTVPGYYNVICTGADSCQHTYHFYLYNSSLTANAGPNGSVGGCCATTINGSASGGIPGYTYSWSPANGLSSSTVANPSCTIPGTYTLTVTDAFGCTSTDVVVITSGPTCCKIGTNQEAAKTVVNIFPNPSSDDFTLATDGPEVSNMIVYNAIGQMVESFDDVSSGFHFGKNLSQGIYQVSLTYVNGTSEQFKVIKISR